MLLPIISTLYGLHGLYVDKEDILLLDSDILFDPQIVAKLLGYGQADALALNHHTLGEEEIKVIADNDGKVLEISKTCSISRAIGESIGIEKMSAAYTEALFRIGGYDYQRRFG